VRYKLRLMFTTLRGEIRPMTRLAAPLVLAEISWVSMGIVDTMMVGRLPNGTEAIGAVSIGNLLFYIVGIFGSGLLLGLDTLVSQSFGAGKVRDCHHSLLNGVYLVLCITPILMGTMWSLVPLLHVIGVAPPVLRLAVPYLHVLLWSAPPLMLYFAFRRYLQGMNLVKPVAIALVGANLLNVFGNWVLINGRLGAPALGVEGSAWSTSLARTLMASILIYYVAFYERRNNWGLRRVRLRPDFDRIRQLVRLGFPAALHIFLEIGIFGTATALAGTLGAAALASHQIAIHTVSLTFMVPLGIASAAAVRVGQAIGRGDPEGASRAGWTAIMLGASFMTLCGLVFLAVPQWLVRLYTQDREVVTLGGLILMIAAFFQLFDGIQGVAIGALRGTGDTKTAVLVHLISDWIVGLPVAWYFCFRRGWGAPGLWVGLSLAMILAGIFLLLAWIRRLRRLTGLKASRGWR
jgi:multidrug resistance protein, MATE family